MLRDPRGAEADWRKAYQLGIEVARQYFD